MKNHLFEIEERDAFHDRKQGHTHDVHPAVREPAARFGLVHNLDAIVRPDQQRDALVLQEVDDSLHSRIEYPLHLVLEAIVVRSPHVTPVQEVLTRGCQQCLGISHCPPQFDPLQLKRLLGVQHLLLHPSDAIPQRPPIILNEEEEIWSAVSGLPSLGEKPMPRLQLQLLLVHARMHRQTGSASSAEPVTELLPRVRQRPWGGGLGGCTKSPCCFPSAAKEPSEPSDDRLHRNGVNWPNNGKRPLVRFRDVLHVGEPRRNSAGLPIRSAKGWAKG
mmetsp:Transcript_58414/g.94500  ORF Transcript_58414/g.94500 Transcript_58414/m.94500 type:complete len:275 (+) Transcript_58414:58-882(+)